MFVFQKIHSTQKLTHVIANTPVRVNIQYLVRSNIIFTVYVQSLSGIMLANLLLAGTSNEQSLVIDIC